MPLLRLLARAAIEVSLAQKSAHVTSSAWLRGLCRDVYIIYLFASKRIEAQCCHGASRVRAVKCTKSTCSRSLDTADSTAAPHHMAETVSHQIAYHRCKIGNRLPVQASKTSTVSLPKCIDELLGCEALEHVHKLMSCAATTAPKFDRASRDSYKRRRKSSATSFAFHRAAACDSQSL